MDDLPELTAIALALGPRFPRDLGLSRSLSRSSYRPRTRRSPASVVAPEYLGRLSPSRQMSVERLFLSGFYIFRSPVSELSSLCLASSGYILPKSWLKPWPSNFLAA